MISSETVPVGLPPDRDSLAAPMLKHMEDFFEHLLRRVFRTHSRKCSKSRFNVGVDPTRRKDAWVERGVCQDALASTRRMAGRDLSRSDQ